jgi:ferredoxin
MPVISKIEIRNASITRDNLLMLLDKLSADRALIAPVRCEGYDDVNFLPVSDVRQICFDYDQTPTSLKEFFFPQHECMFSFSGNSHETIEGTPNDEEIVVFGIRSCDVKGVELLDRFYERKLEDNYYLDKRRKSTLISVACSKLNDQCFCTATGTGPVLEEGFDIQLIETDGKYGVQVGSEKGLELFETWRQFFGPGIELDVKDLLAEARQQGVKFDLERVYKNLKEDVVDGELWEDMGRRCQSCGLCLFVCPTCSCFSVTDGATPLGENRRSRQWDGCYFMGMTTMTGENNPVSSRAEMMKRKYRHKLLQQIDEFGMSGCTGCGRCSLACVGNVNWLENIIRIERGR